MLSDLLGGIALGDVGLSGLVVLFVLSIYFGRLVTKNVYENAREDAKTWRQVALTAQQTAETNSASLQELLSSSRATTHALQEIQAAGAYALSQRKREGESG